MMSGVVSRGMGVLDGGPRALREGGVLGVLFPHCLEVKVQSMCNCACADFSTSVGVGRHTCLIIS